MSERFFTLIFSIWFLLFPFDAFVFPVSIGFMTIYPYLLLTVFLFGFLIWRCSLARLFSYQKYALGAFILLMFYAISYLPFVANFKSGLMDVRSMILQAFTVGIIFLTFQYIGRKTFSDLVFKLSTLVFIFYSLVAWLEYYTGIHLAGRHTDKLLNYPIGNITYAPVFIYDNPNTFLVYLFATAFIIFLIKPVILKSLKWSFAILFTLLFFALIADSRIGKYISEVLILYSIANYLIINKSFLRQFYFKWMFFLIASLLIVIFTHPIFLGPIWKKRDDYILKSIVTVRLESGKPVFSPADSVASQVGMKEFTDAFNKYNTQNTMSSGVVRRHLIENGLFLIKQNPILGVGPGQYTHLSNVGKLPKNTGTVNSPHELLTELGSQYGIPMLLMFLLSFFFAALQAWKLSVKQRWKFFQWLMIALFSLGIGAMPSAWFVLNGGWLLLAILIISVEFISPELT